jgi:segregation and condensation protein B
MRPALLGPAARRPYSVRPGNVRLPLVLRYAPTAEPTAADPLARDGKLARLEAALVLADEPLTARRLAEVAALTDTAEARRLIEKLRSLYDAGDGSAFQVEEIAGGYQLLTRPAFHPWLVRLRRTGHDLRLTPAALETLAVIAYKQPITRAEVDAVRGVQCGEIVRMLMEKGLVRHAGRHDSLGRPQLYGTTKKFLQAFGLIALKDLPEVESLKRPT